MKRKYIILLHILVWLLLVLNETVSDFRQQHFRSYWTLNSNVALFARYFCVTFFFSSISALCFYGSYLVVSPLLFARKKYLKALLSAMGLLAALVSWRYIIEFVFFKPVLGFDNYKGHNITTSFYISNIFWYYYPKYFLYGTLYFLAANWIIQRNRQEALEKEKLATELAFLRSQINPHFLFNTINDIYTLTYQRSPQAPEALLKLSQLLRYMLRENTAEYVPLQNEIDYLNNLINLQRIGTKDKACIDFEIEGYIGTRKIAPLLFVTFIENAFKHGILNDPVNPVHIRLQVTSEFIVLKVRNKISHGNKDDTGGIGLHNVKRRLALLYPGQHLLQIHHHDYYEVYLQIHVTV